MQSSINGKHQESQLPEVLPSLSQFNLSAQELTDAIYPVLYNRDKKDCFILEYILIANISEKRPVRVEDLMEYMGLSNPSISIRLKKMRELIIPGLDIPFITTTKSGNALLYYFTNLIDREKALSIVQAIMKKRNVSYEEYAIEKGILDEELEDLEIENEELDELDEENEEDKDEIVDELDELDEENEDDWIDENQALEKISFDELSTRTVTMGEVLEMIDEASNTLIETITEGVTEVFNEKITQLNNRIAELEKKISSSQASINKEESTEELLARARMLVRQKIFAEKNK
ncbi:hypothetical protein NIES4103_13590 [Nostoc sp. NIES-4103]|nr:hypothetical protein NIES4103_13590 [Nostoc sp. NIES-4103]